MRLATRSFEHGSYRNDPADLRPATKTVRSYGLASFARDVQIPNLTCATHTVPEGGLLQGCGRV